MNLAKGERVYVRKTGKFANVVKTGGILGIKDSYATIDDFGERLAFIGKSSEFAYTSSGNTPSGENITIPEDGVSMILECGLCSKYNTGVFASKYNSMTTEEKISFCENWQTLSDDDKTKLLEGPVVVAKSKPNSKSRKEKTSLAKK